MRFFLSFAFYIFLTLSMGGMAHSQEAKPAETAQSPEVATEALVKILENPQERAKLIEFLKTSAEKSGAKPVGSSLLEEEQTIAALISSQFNLFTGNLIKLGWQVWVGLSGYESLAEGQPSFKQGQFLAGFQKIAGVLVSAYLVFFLVRKGVRGLSRRFERRVREQGWTQRLVFLLFSSGMDFIAVALGTLAGYIAALAMVEGIAIRTMSVVEEYSLNAFVFIEMMRILLNFAFAPSKSKFRIFPFSDFEATYWVRHLMVVVMLLGYGIGLLKPVVDHQWNASLAGSVGVTVALITLIYFLSIIWVSRKRVRRAIRQYITQQTSPGMLANILTSLSFFWGVLAAAYGITVFVVWVSKPETAIFFIGRASLYTVIVLLGAVFCALAASQATNKGISFGENMQEKLPSLEGRLNYFLPFLLTLFRIAVVILTVFAILEIWGASHIWSWFWKGGGSTFNSRISSAFMVLLVGLFLWVVAMSWVDLQLVDREGYRVTARKVTLYNLFRNAFTIVFIVIFSLLALSELGIEIGPLIAGAGVIGLAVSFGAQKLVQDVITGAFIQIENAMNEGDVVTVSGITGTVERLTIRSVRLRDLSGVSHTIPFSSVDTVSNAMKEFSYFVCVMSVSYDTEVSKAKQAMQEAFDRLMNTSFAEGIVDVFEMHGVTTFAASSVDIRARIKTLPGQQWAVGRAYNEIVKQVFDEQSIEIPFPQVTYHQAKDSSAPLPPQLPKRSWKNDLDEGGAEA
ncbi:mechanosensitive ion channel domain-containing protein [Flexibacterium corallicola]|uniref:mechanosensitive ion channel domain-containing protein n=1 Tax=Flexibacterium corallicola TaxID=3037259 RepID=UPI00286EED02|nr:mechanosensitive ion channel domain-containing protein [Pseudovibrio sp. M1P-2-3]